MNCQWQQTAPDRIEIQANPRPVLFLIGLPFVGIGLWQAWNILGAALDVATGKVKFMDNLGSFTLLPVVAAFFLIPGVVLSFAKKRWVVNSTKGEAEETTSILFWSWGRRHHLGKFKAVRAYQGKEDSRSITENPSEEDDRRYTVKQPYCVDLISAEPKPGNQTVGATQDAVGAILLGRALANLIQKPFMDDTMKAAEDTEEDGLRYRAEMT